MLDSPAQLDDRPGPGEDGPDALAAPDARDAPGETGEHAASAVDEPRDDSDASEDRAAFGTQRPTRFAADVEYRGRAEEHDYVVRVRHRLLDSTFTVVIDGIEHDPKAEEKARKRAAEPAQDPDADAVTETGLESAPDPGSANDSSGDAAAGDDDLQFRLEENFASIHCTVRRRKLGREDATDGTSRGHGDAEVITVRTAGLGGAGEVDVRRGLERTLLMPEQGSPSAARDVKRTAHPARYALMAALAKSAGFLIPLLGFGALFSGLLDPIKEWLGARLRPVIEAITGVLGPIRDWFADLLRPVGEFFEALLAPVRDFVGALLRPVGRLRDWLVDLLFGWIPELSLPFSIPEWVVDVSIPVLVVLGVFLVTFRGLRRRGEKLEATQAASAQGAGKPVAPGRSEEEGSATQMRAGSATRGAGTGEGEDGGESAAGRGDERSEERRAPAASPAER